MSLHTLLFVTNFLYLGRPSPRLQALAKPLLASLRPADGAAAVGLHLRIGDTALANTGSWNESRFPPECGFCALQDDEHHLLAECLLPRAENSVALETINPAQAESEQGIDTHQVSTAVQGGMLSVGKVTPATSPKCRSQAMHAQQVNPQ